MQSPPTAVGTVSFFSWSIEKKVRISRRGCLFVERAMSAFGRSVATSSANWAVYGIPIVPAYFLSTYVDDSVRAVSL